MPTAPLLPEETLLATSAGRSVYDALVQANLDPRTVAAAAIERMLNTERLRRSKPGWPGTHNPLAICS